MANHYPNQQDDLAHRKSKRVGICMALDQEFDRFNNDARKSV